MVALASGSPLTIDFHLDYQNATGDAQEYSFSHLGIIPDDPVVGPTETGSTNTGQVPTATSSPTVTTKKTTTTTKKPTSVSSTKNTATSSSTATSTAPTQSSETPNVAEATPNGGLTGVVESASSDDLSVQTEGSDPLTIKQVPIPEQVEQSGGSNVIMWIAIVSLGIGLIFWQIRRRRQSMSDPLTALTPPSEVVQPRSKFIPSPRMAVAIVAGLAIFVGWRFTQRQIMADIEARPDNGKYVVNVGWNDPDINYLVANQALVASVPLDGLILGAASFPGASNNNLLSRTFSNADLKRDQFEETLNKWNQIKDLPSLRHSLVRVNTASRYMPFDNDDSWEKHVLPNWRVAAELVKEAGLEGFFLDTEVYQSNPSIYDYPTTYNGVDLTTLTFDEVQTLTAPLRKKAEDRGRQMAEILNTVFTDRPVDILFSILPSHFTFYSNSPERNWQGVSYELFPSFIDGFVIGAGESVKMYDGYERSYPIKSDGSDNVLTTFRSVRSVVSGQEGGAIFSRYPDLYRQKMGLGLAMWLDYSQTTPWYYQRGNDWYRSYVDVSSTPTWVDQSTSEGTSEDNYLSPTVLRQTLTAALRTTDKYVWVYNQRPDIWGSRKTQATWNMPLSSEYKQALTLAHSGNETNRSPVWYELPTMSALTGHSWQQAITSDLAPDPDGDSVVIAPYNLPQGMKYDSVKGILSWVPKAGTAGNQNVQIKASDGVSSSIGTINLVVTASVPEVSYAVRADKQSLKPGEQVQYSLRFINEGNDLARAVKLEASLPGRLTVVSGADVVGGRLVVSLGDMAPKDTRELTITLRLD